MTPFFWREDTLQSKLQCFSTLATFFYWNVRRRVLTTLFSELPWTIRVSFQKQQKVFQHFLRGWLFRVKSDCWRSNNRSSRFGEASHSRRIYTNRVYEKCTKHFLTTWTWMQVNRNWHWSATDRHRFFPCLKFSTESSSGHSGCQLLYNFRLERSHYTAKSPQLSRQCMMPSASLLHTPWNPVPCWRTSRD